MRQHSMQNYDYGDAIQSASVVLDTAKTQMVDQKEEENISTNTSNSAMDFWGNDLEITSCCSRPQVVPAHSWLPQVMIHVGLVGLLCCASNLTTSTHTGMENSLAVHTNLQCELSECVSL